MDPPVEQPGAIVPVPPAQDDAADDDDGGGPEGEGPRGGGPLDDVDEDDEDPPAIEGAPAPAPRMSQRERRGVLTSRMRSDTLKRTRIDSRGLSTTNRYNEPLFYDVCNEYAMITIATRLLDIMSIRGVFHVNLVNYVYEIRGEPTKHRPAT